MSIKYQPSKLIRKIAPPEKIENLLRGNLTVNKAALSFVSDIDFLDKKQILDVALKTVKGYRERVKDETVLRGDLLDDPKQLVQRVQNEIILQIKDGIKESYAGESYRWLPSDADEPDPEHQSLYGRVFQVGVGEMPGDRIGCRCGMEILVPETKLEI